MRNLISVLIMLLLCVSCGNAGSTKEENMLLEEVVLFKKSNPIGEKLGLGNLYLDSVIVFGKDSIDSLRICFLEGRDPVNSWREYQLLTAVANLKETEFLEGLCLYLYIYRDEDGKRLKVMQSLLPKFDNSSCVIFKDCKTDRQVEIMNDVYNSNSSFPQQLDEVTIIDSIAYFPINRNYTYYYALTGAADNDLLDFKVVKQKIRAQSLKNLKLMVKNKKEIRNFYEALWQENVLLKYVYYSASTSRYLFSFTINPKELL